MNRIFTAAIFAAALFTAGAASAQSVDCNSVCSVNGGYFDSTSGSCICNSPSYDSYDSYDSNSYGTGETDTNCDSIYDGARDYTTESK